MSDTHDRRQAVLGRITLAQLHVQVGDSRGVQLAHRHSLMCMSFGLYAHGNVSDRWCERWTQDRNRSIGS